jgi:hypothetical protein
LLLLLLLRWSLTGSHQSQPLQPVPQHEGDDPIEIDLEDDDNPWNPKCSPNPGGGGGGGGGNPFLNDPAIPGGPNACKRVVQEGIGMESYGQHWKLRCRWMTVKVKDNLPGLMNGMFNK